ncbi:MAG: hypothetical protein AB7V43_04510 [Acidimicrobiia bacterium]
MRIPPCRPNRANLRTVDPATRDGANPRGPSPSLIGEHIPGPNTLRGPEDALSIFQAARSRPALEETFVLLLDDAHTGADIVCINDASSADCVQRIVTLLCGLAEQSWLAGLVVATARPFATTVVDDDDLHTWFTLRVLADDAGVDLIDWFVLIDGISFSIADYTQSTSLWIP